MKHSIRSGRGCGRLAGLLAVAWTACSSAHDSGLESEPFGLVFAEDYETGCATPMSLRGGLPADVDRIVVQVERATDDQVVATRLIRREDLGSQREVLLTGIPEGDYRLNVTGCQGDPSNPDAVWSGLSATFHVTAGFKAAPIVHLTREGTLNCVGGKNQNPLQPAFDGDRFFRDGRAAFSSVAITRSGRVLVTGGFSTDEYRPDGDLLTAGRRVSEFHRETGVFTGVFTAAGGRLELGEGRAGHASAALAASDQTEWVILAGGVATAVLGPADYPTSAAPLDHFHGVQSAIEVLELPASGDPSARSLSITHPAAFPSVAFSEDARTVALVGGRNEGGQASDAITLWTLDEDALDGRAQPAVRSGTLVRAHFGARAFILGTGQVLVLGGFDGSGFAGVELAAATAGNAVSSAPVPVSVPAGVEGTAFASAIVVEDDRSRARVLVLGGHPMPGGGVVFTDVTAPNAWVLKLSGDGNTYQTAEAEAVPGTADWAARSFAGLVRSGDVFWLLGGMRSFNRETVAGCGSAAPVWGAYCFPRIVTAFRLGSDGLSVVASFEDTKSRLGAAVAAQAGGEVFGIGGLDGWGARPSPLPADFDPLLSTGFQAVLEGSFDPGPCRIGPN